MKTSKQIFVVFCVASVVIELFSGVVEATGKLTFGPSQVNVDCVVCNTKWTSGIRYDCKTPGQVHNCTGCMKTVTKVKLKDTGTITSSSRLSEVVSRYCMLPGAQGGKPEGCYKHQNNGGYTERCYCYTHNCNSHASRLTSLTIASLLLTALLFVSATVNGVLKC